MSAEVCVALVAGLVASAQDLITRRISNWIPIALLVLGLMLHVRHDGWSGAGASLLGGAAGFSVFLIFYIFGGMGGGDVKLMAGFGSLLGVHRLLEAALWTAACGGIMAAVFIAIGTLRGILRRRSRTGDRTSASGEAEREATRTDFIPYAPAIAAGVWLSLVPKS